MSETIILMDSDFCENCDELLSYGESGLCAACLEQLCDEEDEDWSWLDDEDDGAFLQVYFEGEGSAGPSTQSGPFGPAE